MNVIDTPRLTLRKVGEGDAGFVLGLLNQPSFLRFVGDRGVRTLEQARDYIRKGPIASYERNGFGVWMVELKEERQQVGLCGLVRRDGLDDVDIGFAFLPEFWSRGYATEASRAVLDYARAELGLQRIVAFVTPENLASIRVLEKLGLRFEKKTRLAGDDTELNLMASDLHHSRWQ